MIWHMDCYHLMQIGQAGNNTVELRFADGATVHRVQILLNAVL